MTKIAIITAMQSEFDALHALYEFQDDEKASRAVAYGKQIVLIKSGMGKVNAAIATDYACKDGADLVINTGLAGGIDETLSQGDVVISEKSCYHDVWCGEPNALGQVQNMPLYYDTPAYVVQTIALAAPDFKIGLIVTGDQFITDIKRLKEIKSAFPKALVTDMESAAVAQTCYINNTPYLSLRIVSDVIGKKEQQEQYQNFWQTFPNKAAAMVDTALKSIPDADTLF